MALRFIQISDTHIGPEPGFELEGVRTLDALQRLVDALQGLPFVPDFVVHTGDLAAFPDRRSYDSALEILTQLDCAIYYVPGNHDSAAMMKGAIIMPGAEDLDPGGKLFTYRFEVGSCRFMIVDACGVPELDPHGELSALQLEILERELFSRPPDAIFMHFPPCPLDVPWIDSDMLVLNGSRLHDLILGARGLVRAVFYGHVHRGMQLLRDGVLYQSAPALFNQIVPLPSEVAPSTDSLAPIAFNLVTMDASAVLVKELRIPK